MRVVHFLHQIRSEDGGVVKATLDLCSALAVRGHDVTLVTSDATDVPEAWKNGQSACPRVEEFPPFTGPLKLMSRWAKRSMELLLTKSDLIHIHEFWQPAAAQVAMIAKRVGTPYVVSAHGMLNDWSMAQSALKKQVFMRVVGNRMFRGAGAVHCTAEGEARQAVRWAPIRQTGIVPLVMDMAPYRTLPARQQCRTKVPGNPNTTTVAYMGRLHPQKGVDRLVSAAIELHKSGQPVEVLIAGAGDQAYRESMEKMAEEAGIGDRVHFLGHIGGTRKINMLRGADILVLPSFQENFGLVLVEALACGTPVITTRAVDIWPELEASGSSKVIDNPDASLVASAIRELAQDPARREEMGRLGRAWVLEHLEPQRVLDQFESLYGRLVYGNGMEASMRERIQTTPVAAGA